MKIICVHNNYNQNCEEIDSGYSNEPIIFIKPDTALLKTKDFYIPEFSNEIYFELGLVVKISKLGKYILQENTSKHYEKIGIGLDFTAADLYRKLKTNGMPWEKAKSFDGSAIISDFFSIDNFNCKTNFHIQKNNNIIQNRNIQYEISIIDELISYISKYFTLRVGDLVFIKISSDAVKVVENDLLEIYLNEEKILTIKIY